MMVFCPERYWFSIFLSINSAVIAIFPIVITLTNVSNYLAPTLLHIWISLLQLDHRHPNKIYSSLLKLACTLTNFNMQRDELVLPSGNFYSILYPYRFLSSVINVRSTNRSLSSRAKILRVISFRVASMEG